MRVAIVVAVSCLSAASFCGAQDAQASIKKFTDIPAQELVPALKTLAHERGFQVVFLAEVVGDRHTQGAVGNLTTTEALTRLLEGTNLVYSYLNDKTVTIIPVNTNNKLDGQGASVGAPDHCSDCVGSYALENQVPATKTATAEAAPGQNSDGESDSGKDSTTTPDTVQEIIVTAQKRSERLQDVPVSITALDATSLTQQNLVTLQDYVSRVPGLTYAGTQQGEIAIRGVTTGFGTNPTVSILVDDVPFGSSTAFPQANSLDLDPADVRQVEVLRGPQGTLYGASSLGGLIKYTTIEPNTHKFSATAESDGDKATDGGYGYGLRGTANVPLVDGVAALRVSGFYREDPPIGYDALTGQHDANHSHAYGWRAALRINPIEPLTIDLTAFNQQLSSFGNAGGTRVEEYVDSNYRPQYGDLGYSNLAQPSFDKDRLYTGRVNYDLDFATVTSITSYSQYLGNQAQDLTQLFSGLIPVLSLVGVNIPATDRTLLGNGHSTNKWTEEFRLASKGNQKLDWLVGFFYTHEKSDNPQVLDANGSGSPINIYTGQRLSTYKEYAGFADLTYHFTPEFDIQVGDRYAHNSQTFTTVASGPLEILTTGDTSPVVTRGISSEGAWTWLVTPRYRFSPNLMAYVRIATGYRPGGPNLPQTGVPDAFRSDKTTNYEVGVKGELWDNKVRFDADGFWIDWSNIQLLNINKATQFAYTSNGSAARSRGFEASVDYNPWRGLTLGANGAYIEATLTKDLPQSATISPVNGVAGDRLPYSPRWTGNLSAEQQFDLGARSTIYFGGNLSFVGKRLSDFTDTAADPRVHLSSYQQLDLRAGLRRDGYGLNFFVKNANNSRGALTGSYQTNYVPANGYVLNLINPRTIGLNLTASF